MPGVMERVDRLETAFASFLERTEEALERADKDREEARASFRETLERADQNREEAKAWFREMHERTDLDRKESDARFRELLERADKNREEAKAWFRELLERADQDREEARASFREMHERTDLNRKESDARFRELLERADQDREEARTSFRETLDRADQDREKSGASFREMLERADRDREATRVWLRQVQQQAEKERKDFNKRLAELSDSMGTLVEDMVAPNARRIASEIFPHDPVVRLAQRVRQVHPADPGRLIEIDLLVAGNEHLMIVEAKRRLTSEKIREFVKRIRTVPEFMPEYARHKLVPVVASVTIAPSAITFLNRQRVYGVAMGDETMELVNLGQF